LKVKDVIKLIEREGWILARTRGSHRQFHRRSEEIVMRYMVVIERGETSWGAHVPDLPGCVAVGETEDEVKHLIKEAIEFHLEDLSEAGKPIPVPLSKMDYVDVAA
jgi:predicted RNase H-like HicB family nuclease